MIVAFLALILLITPIADAATIDMFLWSAGHFQSLGTPPGTTSITPRGLNDPGQIVGSYRAGGQAHGFLYDGSFHLLSPPGSVQDSASAINPNGK
jgi:hypothetical protein